MSRQGILTILAFLLVGAVCSSVLAAPLQLKPISPLTPATSPVVKPANGPAIPVVATTRVTLVNPRTLKLEAGAPAKQITLGGSGLDKVTSAQLLRNNQPATGVSLQLLGGAPASRSLRVRALKNAVPGT